MFTSLMNALRRSTGRYRQIPKLSRQPRTHVRSRLIEPKNRDHRGDVQDEEHGTID
jgi:hypothetical protein